jgi:hypothetical protein
MAKREQHSNREPKKPKKDKPKISSVSVGSVWAAVDKARTGGAAKN